MPVDPIETILSGTIPSFLFSTNTEVLNQIQYANTGGFLINASESLKLYNVWRCIQS
jgi:hypothetical protein